MLQQIKQVLNTYLTQRMLWLGALFIVLMTLPNLATLFGQQRKANGGSQMLFLVGMPLFFVLPFLVGHAKLQLAHSRARLIPNFFPSHVVVLGAILFLILVVYPATVAVAGGNEPLGILALILGMGSSFLWGNHLNRLMPMLIGLGAFYSLMTPWGHNWWISEAGQHRGAHATIAIGGLGLVVAWLWRICHLREEDDDYHNAFAAALARRSGSEAVEERRIVAWQIGRNQLTSRIGDWWHARIGGYYGGSSAGLARLLRYGFTPIPVEVQAFFFALMMVSIGFFFGQFSLFTSKRALVAALFAVGPLAIVGPGVMAGELMARRRARAASELTLPVSRRQLIDSLFAVAARTSACVWVVTNAALGILILMLNQDVSLQDVAKFAVLSATVGFVTFGVSLRTSVWTSTFKRLAVLWCSYMGAVALLPLLTTLNKYWGITAAVALVLALIAVGTVATYSARRTWLNLEFA